MPRAAVAQDEPLTPPAEILRVFLDCHGPCDFDFIRREITYVNWVRDRQDADVHLLLTTRGTGGGGQEYTLKSIGLRAFAGSEDEFIFNSRQSDTFDEIRALIVQRIGLGLARFAARGPRRPARLIPRRPPRRTARGAAQRDPWTSGSLPRCQCLPPAQSRSGRSLSGSFRARRITMEARRRRCGTAQPPASRTTSANRAFRERLHPGLLGVQPGLRSFWLMGWAPPSRDNYDCWCG
jgi:hypothetical protein